MENPLKEKQVDYNNFSQRKELILNFTINPNFEFCDVSILNRYNSHFNLWFFDHTPQIRLSVGSGEIFS
jgi:hypothetical protein